MRIVLLLCAAFVLKVATEPIRAKLGVQPNMTQEEMPGPLLTQTAERKTKDLPLPVMEPGTRTLGDMRPSGEEPIKAKLAVQPRMTQEAMPGPLLIQAAERKTRGQSFPVMEAGQMTMGGMGSSGCGCLPDWYQYGSRCFKLFTTPMNWINAEKYCMYFGAHLASIHNPGEHDLIYSMASETNYDRAWIGGSDAVETFTWLWSDGSMFYYTNWGPGEPNNWHEQEKCNEMNIKGWNDLNCEDSIPFICGTRPDGPL